MPRNYTQIMCAIWDDPEFLALSEGAQRAYFMLVSQRDISAAGVLHIWTPRWAALSCTSTDETLKAALSELKQARFIVPDWMTGELLVRSFVRWDGGYKNGKRKPLIEREARGVGSVHIKTQLRVEFEKLNEELRDTLKLDTSGLPNPTPPGGPEPPADRASDGTSDAGSSSSSIGSDGPSASTSNGIAHRSGAPSADHATSTASAAQLTMYSQVDSLSDVTSQVASDVTSASRGVVGTPVVTTGEPNPQIPQPVPPPAGDEPAPPNLTDGQALVGYWIDLCRKRPPGSVIGQAGKVIAAMLEDDIAFGDIQAGIDVWSAKGLHPAALPSVVNEVMNARPHLRLASGGGGPQRVATTTLRVQAALEHLDPEEP